MTRQEYKDKLSFLSDNELYNLAKRQLIFSFITPAYSGPKLELLYNECQKRNEKIFPDAMNDANLSIISLATDEKIINIKRIDYMNADDLEELFNRHENEEDDSVPADDYSGIICCDYKGRDIENPFIRNGDKLIIDIDGIADDSDIAAFYLDGSFCIGIVQTGEPGQIMIKTEFELINSASHSLEFIGIIQQVIRAV